MLAGSAAARPSALASPLSDTVTFSATVIIGGDHFTVNSTTCRLHDAGATGSIPCRVSGAGALDSEGNPVSADLAITSKDGPIALHVTNLYGCGAGTGVEIDPTGPTNVTSQLTISNTTEIAPNMLLVSGTIKVWDGTRDVCAR
jgi:hypothetical protein